jgi:hypothetical protein
MCGNGVYQALGWSDKVWRPPGVAFIHVGFVAIVCTRSIRCKGYNCLLFWGGRLACALCLFPVDRATRLFSGVPMRCGSYWKPSGLAPNDQATAPRLAIEAPLGSSCCSFGSAWDWTLHSLFSSHKRRAAGGIPPPGNNTARMQLCGLSKARPISCSDCPAFHRLQTQMVSLRPIESTRIIGKLRMLSDERVGQALAYWTPIWNVVKTIASALRFVARPEWLACVRRAPGLPRAGCSWSRY